MLAYIFVAISGCLVVLQTGFNKNIAQSWGLSSSLFLNGVVFLAFNLLWFVAVWSQPKLFSPDYGIQGDLADFRLWWLLPGLFGFLLVMGVTIAIKEIGAVQTFIISITAQVLTSILWDMFAEGKEVSAMRLTGAAITVMGAFLTMK